MRAIPLPSSSRVPSIEPPFCCEKPPRPVVGGSGVSQPEADGAVPCESELPLARACPPHRGGRRGGRVLMRWVSGFSALGVAGAGRASRRRPRRSAGPCRLGKQRAGAPPCSGAASPRCCEAEKTAGPIAPLTASFLPSFLRGLGRR